MSPWISLLVLILIVTALLYRFRQTLETLLQELREWLANRSPARPKKRTFSP